MGIAPTSCFACAAIVPPGAAGFLLALAVLLALAAFAMTGLALRARRAKHQVPASGVVGLTGRAETTIAPEGAVFVRGELWQARASSEIGRGERVRVIGLDSSALRLIVERDDQGR
ncbi:MAG TPA: NfeD family protein [Blastocatellia bacterium]|nr:NfeD family protein [Blastocatellia bacterium]